MKTSGIPSGVTRPARSWIARKLPSVWHSMTPWAPVMQT